MEEGNKDEDDKDGEGQDQHSLNKHLLVDFCPRNHAMDPEDVNPVAKAHVLDKQYSDYKTKRTPARRLAIQRTEQFVGQGVVRSVREEREQRERTRKIAIYSSYGFAVLVFAISLILLLVVDEIVWGVALFLVSAVWAKVTRIVQKMPNIT